MSMANKRKIKGSRKQNKSITRLMAISILVDRHIYKNELISSKQAEEFLDEVTSLKLLCEGDERSLQVIDKLQTFMKIIINEQSSGDTSVTKNNNNTRNLTPVQTNDSNSKETPLTELQRKCTDFINPTPVNVQILEKTRSNPILLEPDTCEEIHISSDACNLDSITRQNLKSIENFENNLQDACHNDVRVNEHTESNTPNVTQYQNYPSAKENVVSIKQSQIDSELSDNNKSSSINIKNINSKNKMTKRSKPKNKSRTDLSWIENIRFVREICADEHTHTDIQDNFWTDLSLPDTCDFDDK